MSEATKIPAQPEVYWGVDLAFGPDQCIISEWRRGEDGKLKFVRNVPDTQNQRPSSSA